MPREDVRRYVALVQDARGYPARSAPLEPAPPEGPAPPMLHTVVLEDDFNAARAQAENLAEALDELLIGGADAVSMEYAKRAAKVVLRSYRKARDA